MPSIFISGIPKGLDRTTTSLRIRRDIERVAQVKTIGIQKDKGYGYVSLFDENSADFVLSLSEKIFINGKALRITKWRNTDRVSNKPRKTIPPVCKHHVNNEVFIFRCYDTYTSYKHHQPHNDILYQCIPQNKKKKPKRKPWKSVIRLSQVPSPQSTSKQTKRRNCKRKGRRMKAKRSTLSSNAKWRERRNLPALCNADNTLEKIANINQDEGTLNSKSTIKTLKNHNQSFAKVHVYEHAKRLFSIEVDNDNVLESIHSGLRNKFRWPNVDALLISHAGKIVSNERQPKMANEDNIHIVVKGRGGMKEGDPPDKEEMVDTIETKENERPHEKEEQGGHHGKNKQGTDVQDQRDISKEMMLDKHTSGNEENSGDPSGVEMTKNYPDEKRNRGVVQGDPGHHVDMEDSPDECKQGEPAHQVDNEDPRDKNNQGDSPKQVDKEDSCDYSDQGDPVYHVDKEDPLYNSKEGDPAHQVDDTPDESVPSSVQVQLDQVNLSDQSHPDSIPGGATGINNIADEDRPINTLGLSTAQVMVPSSLFKSTFSQGSEASQTYLINKLELKEYFPDQLTFTKVMSVSDNQKDEADRLSDIPRLILRKLIMLDFNSRDNDLNACFNKLSSVRDGLIATRQEVSSILSDNDYDSIFNDVDDVDDDDVHDEEVPSNVDKHNPVDVFLSVFVCLHPTFKQKVCLKMFTCRLAIPLIFPVRRSERQSKALMFSMWPLRSITVHDGKTETSIVNCKQNVVSFIRLGRPLISKSKLANELLFDNAHHSFVNYDSTLGPIDKKACLGLVEASWFLPSPKENKKFKYVTLFLNLRGDAMHNSEQIEYLKKVSCVMIIVLDKETMKNQRVMEYYKIPHFNVLFLLAGNVSRSFINRYKQIYMRSAPDHFSAEFVQVTEKGQNISLSEIKETVLNITGTWLNGKESCKSVQDMCIQAQKLGMNVDETRPTFKSGLEQANKIFDKVQNCPLADIKVKFAPLQKECWNKITVAMKEFRKAGQDISVKERLKQDMELQRKKQWESVTPFMLDFIDIFVELRGDKLVAFLDSLKFELDEKSRKEMPDYRKEYAEAWNTLKKNNKADKASALTDVNTAEQNLSDASFGIEHIFRELGQIYEASVFEENGRLGKQLAKAVVRSINLGYPFELMDGDVANVPTKWISQIFDELKNTLTDKKVLTLSILGLQSSGKSTLLNAMFGLTFSVSAGRCTRGVYLQLLPVCKGDFKFDYVLVVDTEGLRAPELGRQKHQHDNELATLVLGMADITLVNIKGENTSEVKDILQICVHAFLRLQMANKNLKLRQSCLFIHQNVSDVCAKESMIHARKKLDEILDNITLEAAEEENIMDIKCFKDVIDFDSNRHVWYFSDLWKGDPPMAPANPGYSRDVQHVKSLLFSTLAHQRDSYLTISDTFVHIKDLWNGILANDFVFGFKNSLEIRAYNALENKYRSLIWTLEISTKDLITNAEGKMKHVVAKLHEANKSDGRLSHRMDEINKECHQMFQEKQLELREDLMKHFDQTESKDVIAQWKETKSTSWNCIVEESTLKLTKHLDNMQDHCKVDYEVRTSLENSKKDIYGKAKNLAEKMKGNRPSTKDMEKSFRELWQRWIKGLHVHEEHSDDISKSLGKILYDTFHNQRDVVNTEWKGRRFGSRKLFEKLENSLDDFKFDDCYVRFRRKLINYIPVLGTDKKKVINDYTNMILKDIDVRLKDLREKEWKFDATEIKEITQCIVQHINTHNQDNTNYFTLLVPYTVKLVVHVFECALPLFESLDSEYKAKHSMKTKLNNHEAVVWRLFQDVVDEKSATMIASNSFCEIIRENVEEVVKSQLSQEIYEDIVKDFSISKRILMTYILKDLAEKNEAQLFIDYISNPYSYAFEWLEKYIDDQCFNHGLYAKKASSELKWKFGVILKSLENSSNTRSLHDWIIYFQNDIKDTVWITIESFFAVEDQTITNLEDFLTTIKTDLEKVQVELEEKFRRETKESVKWYNDKTPYKLSIDKLWGCTVVCPFCKEPCQWGLSHTGTSHSCIQHRASGVSGRNWKETKKLVVHSCSFSLQAGYSFSCHKPCKGVICKNTSNDDLFHPYRKYRDYIPDWNIYPCPDMSSSYYWAWVISTFNEHFAKCYRSEKADIPEGWEKYTKDKAIESLHNMD